MTASCVAGYECAKDGGRDMPHWDWDGTEKVEKPGGNERR